jgi:hypothetical protein
VGNPHLTTSGWLLGAEERAGTGEEGLDLEDDVDLKEEDDEELGDDLYEGEDLDAGTARTLSFFSLIGDWYMVPSDFE